MQALFDAKAPGWARKYRPSGPLARRLSIFSGAVVESAEVAGPGAPAGSGRRLLDLGCGTGELARCLADSGFAVVACDISREMLSRARVADENGEVCWTALDRDWGKLPWESGAFAVVTCSSVMEYVADTSAVLAECARVLRPGGVLLATVPDTRHPVRWLESAAWMAARAPGVRKVGARSERVDGYLRYLALSRQRHPVRWWESSARSAGLVPWRWTGPVPSPALRLLRFRRTGDGQE